MRNDHPLRVVKYRCGPLDNNTYLVVDESVKQAVIIDPSFDSAPLWDMVQENGWRITEVLNTHAHIDHVVENALFMELAGVGLALHPDEQAILEAMPVMASWLGIEPPRQAEPTHWLADHERISVGGGELTVTLTPGHSPGSVSFIGPGFVVAGDALFAGSIGRTDIPSGNQEQLLESIRGRLLVLPDETVVYPGHGKETTIGVERRTNPFLS